MNVTASPQPSEWKAVSHLAAATVSEVRRNGRKWGEVVELGGEGRAIGYRRLPDGSEDGKPFRGPNAKDDAWRWVVGSPLPWNLVYSLQEQAAEATCPF